MFLLTTRDADGGHSSGTLYIRYKDSSPGGEGVALFANYGDHLFTNPDSSWADAWLGMIPRDGSDEWVTVGVPFPAEIGADTDALVAEINAQGGSTVWVDLNGNLANDFQMTFSGATPSWTAVPAGTYVDRIWIDSDKIWTYTLGTGYDLSTNYRYMGMTPDYSAGWSDPAETIGGRTCRRALGSADPLVAPGFYVTLDSDISEFKFTYYDNDPAQTGFSFYADYRDGGAWQDLYLGTVTLDGEGGWKTRSLPIPENLYADGGDARLYLGDPDGNYVPARYENIPGHQVLIRMWAFDGSAPAGLDLPLAEYEVNNVGFPIATEVPVALSSMMFE
jgi:hypothetical protein